MKKSRSRRWSDDLLSIAVKESRSMAEVLKKLGVVQAGGNYSSIYLHIARLGLTTEHFRGQGWARGTKGISNGIARDLAGVLVENSTYTSTHHLKGRLIKAGLLKAVCDKCGISDWLGKPLILHLDHRNGVRRDFRLENIRLLCPNCHSQTQTYAGRNIGKLRKADGTADMMGLKPVAREGVPVQVRGLA